MIMALCDPYEREPSSGESVGGFIETRPTKRVDSLALDVSRFRGGDAASPKKPG